MARSFLSTFAVLPCLLLLGCGSTSDPGAEADASLSGLDASSEEVCDRCSDNADCVDLGERQECRCKPGYTGDGESCENINECEFDGACHPKAECEDLEGSVRCSCTQGFVGDGLQCREGVIYFSNGAGTGSIPQPFFKSYDVFTGEVRDEASMSPGSNDFCSCGYYSPTINSANGVMYYFANYGQTFDGSWHPVLYPNAKRRGEYGSAVIDGKIYFVGGRGSEGNTTDSVDFFDTRTQSWSQDGAVRAYGWLVDYPAVGAANGLLHVVGGEVPAGVFGTRFSIYNPNTNTWSAQNHAPFTLNNARGVGFNNNFYVINGISVWRYNGNNTWSTLQNTPSTNAKPAVAGNNLYIVGDMGSDVVIHRWQVNTWVEQARIPGVNIGPWSHVGGSD
jgi:hypothetical protein